MRLRRGSPGAHGVSQSGRRRFPATVGGYAGADGCRRSLRCHASWARPRRTRHRCGCHGHGRGAGGPAPAGASRLPCGGRWRGDAPHARAVLGEVARLARAPGTRPTPRRHRGAPRAQAEAPSVPRHAARPAAVGREKRGDAVRPHPGRVPKAVPARREPRGRDPHLPQVDGQAAPGRAAAVHLAGDGRRRRASGRCRPGALPGGPPGMPAHPQCGGRRAGRPVHPHEWGARAPQEPVAGHQCHGHAARAASSGDVRSVGRQAPAHREGVRPPRGRARPR